MNLSECLTVPWKMLKVDVTDYINYHFVPILSVKSNKHLYDLAKKDPIQKINQSSIAVVNANHHKTQMQVLNRHYMSHSLKLIVIHIAACI